MTKPQDYIPRHCRHRAKDLGYVRIDGKIYYTGRWGSPEAKAKYDRLIHEWLANHRHLPGSRRGNEAYRVDDLVAEYWLYFEASHKGTREPETLRYALRPLSHLYGEVAVSDFRPSHLKAVRTFMVEADLSRRLINRRITMLKRMFRWGVEEERVHPDISNAVQAVEGLRRGRTTARDPKRVQPVESEHVEAILPLVSQQVRAMIELQWLTGMRPGEVVRMKPSEIDRSQDPWIYRPTKHKTQHHGHTREVPLGPKCQAILHGFLLRAADTCLFSPREADEEWRARKGANRQSKVTPSQRDRARRAKVNPTRKLNDHYDVHAYARAVARACKQAGVPHWSPNRLRHSAATRIRRDYGIDAARAVLGHTTPAVTEIYAEVDRGTASKVMKEMG